MMMILINHFQESYKELLPGAGAVVISVGEVCAPIGTG